MAPGGVSLRGELRYRDGRRKSVEVEIDGGGGLAAMVAAVKTLQERVSELLTELQCRRSRRSRRTRAAATSWALTVRRRRRRRWCGVVVVMMMMG
ncbi:hypothetical protein CRUP_033113 [Coryphaenoides rupestris]|nr:hypothetical protein CRUP_033113 [Coryphaenoides rupestris]